MERPLPAELALDLNVHRLLLRGTRQFPDAERLARALGSPERRLRRVSPSPFDIESVAPLPVERAVLASCARSVSLGELLVLPHPRPQLVRAAYALLVGGVIDDAPARVATASPGPPQPAGLPPLPSPAEADLTPPPPPPQTPEEAEREARALLEKGFRERAIEVLEQALDRDPGASGVGRLLAMTRGRESGFDPEVEGLLLSRLEKEPQDAELRYALASYYRRAGMAARAVLQLHLVLSADSGHAAAWRDLGELEAGETRRR
jgi:tetratricopeptide (TPR) repeat protein